MVSVLGAKRTVHPPHLRYETDAGERKVAYWIIEYNQ